MNDPSKTVLVVDDSFEDRYTYIRYLKKESSHNYKIIEAETAEEAIELFEEEQPDLILLDFSLPGMNGLEFIAELKAKYDRTPPIIMLTGEGNEAIAIQAMKAGVKDYLIKGKINDSSLCFAVRSVLEQERLQKVARRNETRFRACVENMLDCFGIYTSDRDENGRIIGFEVDYLNEAACKSNLLHERRLVDSEICSLTMFQPQIELFDLCCQVVKTGKSISQEYAPRQQFSKTQTTIFEIRINQLEDGFVAIWRDITERKQIDKALKQSEANFRVLITQAPIGIFQTDAKGDCQYVNPRWLEITGLSFAEAKDKGWSQALHPEDRENIYCEWYQAAREGREFALEYRFRSPKGKTTWVFGRAVAVYDDEGNPNGYFGTIVDISDRKHTESLLNRQREQLVNVNQNLKQTTILLKKRNRELNEFTRIVSHDLKAPLRAINNLSLWIEEDLEGKLDEDTKKNLELLRNRVDRMQVFIESLLRYSRVGKAQTPTEEVIVRDLLIDIADSLAAPATLKIAIGESMPTLNTQRILLQQVFSNLIGNAIKHHPTQVGTVAINVEEKEPFWRFSVTDDGLGIAAEHHKRIFEIFQTLSSKDSTDNTGMGLSIVKKIVEGQGGTVELDSQVGQGTTFYFSWHQ